MDPITAATNAVPLETNRPVAPTNDPTAVTNNTPGVENAGGAAAETQLTDQQRERYTAVAVSFVQQMYITMWREAQRNSSA